MKKSSNLRKKSPKKKDIKDDEDPYIYKKLVNGLRPFATDPDLDDIEIIKEFELHEYDIDKDRMEKCVCGKTELVHLYYMKNRKKMFESDLIDYATSTCIVGKLTILFRQIDRINT